MASEVEVVCPALSPQDAEDICPDVPAITSAADNSSSQSSPDDAPGSQKVVFGYEDPENNLMKNWSFQEPISKKDWRMVNATGTRVEGGHTGQWCLELTDRSDKMGQAAQKVREIKPDTSYYYSCYVKFPTHPEEATFINVRLFIFIKYSKEDRPSRQCIGALKFQRGPTPWLQLGGDFHTHIEDIDWLEPHLEIDTQVKRYHLDTTSLIELPSDPAWKQHMEQLIQQHRTSTVNMSINLPPDVNPSDFKIKVRQTKRDFGIGAAINSDWFNERKAYRQCFFKHFEWAVFSNHTKWKSMEGKKKGKIESKRVDQAVKKLHNRGVTVRGHAIHWNKMESCPQWVHELRGDDLQREFDRRTRYVVEHFKGRFVQWDVMNEHLHHRFADCRTESHDQLARVCRMANQIDPECHLYINDYEVVRNGVVTSAQTNLALELLSEGVPIHGIGIQSHLRHVPIRIEQLKKRVEIVCSAGLPLMMTELSVHHKDVSQRAHSLEEALYIYFSNPQVLGVILWGFTDKCFCDDMPLFDGPDYVPNEAGERLISLLEKWQTKLNISPRSQHSNETFQAYHGHYEVEVIRDGSRVSGQSFQVVKGQILDLDIDVEFDDGKRVEPSGDAGSEDTNDECEGEKDPETCDVPDDSASCDVPDDSCCDVPQDSASCDVPDDSCCDIGGDKVADC